jgi:hypothetical protein
MDSFTRCASDADRSSANPSTVPKRTVADHVAIGNLSARRQARHRLLRKSRFRHGVAVQQYLRHRVAARERPCRSLSGGRPRRLVRSGHRPIQDPVGADRATRSTRKDRAIRDITAAPASVSRPAAVANCRIHPSSDGCGRKRRVGFDQSLLFKLGPEFGRDLRLQRIVVLGNLLMASRPDDEGDRDIWRCRELKCSGA